MIYGTPTIVTNGLVYHFDSLNTLSYISGSSNWSSVVNPTTSASLFTASFSNNALIFNGTSSYGNINNILLSGSFTVNIVFNTTATPSSSFLTAEPLLGTNSGSFEGRNISLSSTSSITLMNMGVYIQEDYPIPTLQTNRYYCLSIVRNSNDTINTYLNGTRSDLGISTTQIPSLFTLDTIANSVQTSFFAGALPVISAYNKVLTETEIRQYVQVLNSRYNFDTTLTNKPVPDSILDMLKVRSELEGSTFESQMYSSSLATLNRIDSIGLLTSASLTVTPATYREGFIYNIKPKKATYNLSLYTQDFIPPGWSFIRMSASYNFPDPFGGNQATLITVISGSGGTRMNQNILLEPNIPYNLSWYVSQSNARYANIIFINAGETTVGATQIDFISQSFYINNGGAALRFNPRNLTLQGLSNGWYRASYTVTPTASIANKLYKTVVIPNTSSVGSYTADISASVYIYGVQITKGSELQPYQRIISSSTQDSVYTRATTATTIDRNGFVTQVPYNLVTNTENGLSIEGGTVVRNTLIAPDGTQTADIFTKTGNLTISQDVGLESVSPHSGSSYTLSFWTKLADTGSIISSMDIEIFIFSGSTPVFPQIQPGSYDITNQWQKIERVFQITGTLVSSLSIRAARQSSIISPANDRFFSIWGLQLTKGSGSLDYQSNFTRLNHPTIDYSAGPPAIRVSAGAENYFTWSNDLTNPVWIKNGLTVSTSSFLSPSGEYNSFTLTATSSNASIKQTNNITNRIGLFAIYVRRKTGTGPIILSVGSFTSSIQPTSEWGRYQSSGFLFTGSYTASSGVYTIDTTIPHGFEVGDFQGFGVGAAVNQINSTVTSVITSTSYTFSSGTTTASGSCTISPRAGKLTIITQGDEIDVWGPQSTGTGYSTANNFFTTSSLNYVKEYVPTSTTSVTRNSEAILLSNLSSSIQINPTSGSFYMEFAYPHTPNGFYTTFDLINIFNASGSNFLRLEASVFQSLGTQGFRWRYIPNNLLSTNFTSPGLLVFNKLIIVLTTTTMKFFVNGVQIGTTQTLTTPIDLSLDRMSVGNYVLIKSMLYFPHTLTDAQSIALTT